MILATIVVSYVWFRSAARQELLRQHIIKHLEKAFLSPSNSLWIVLELSTTLAATVAFLPKPLNTSNPTVPWHWGSLSLHRQRWNLQIFIRKRRCTSPRLSQHYSGKASLTDSSLNIYILSSVMRIQTTTGCWRWTEACGWIGATSKHSIPGYTLVPALRWRSLLR